MGHLLNTYILASFGAFVFSVLRIQHIYDNYFAFSLAYWNEPLTNIILYNFCLAFVVMIQKLTIFYIFQEMKENQRLKIMEKLKLKSLQVLVIIIIYHDQFSFTLFVGLLMLTLLFIIHNHMNLRAEYLINTHNPSLKKDVKITCFMLIIMFIDYEIIKNSYTWIFSHGGLPIFLLFCIFRMLLTALEPFIKLAVHLYERFTEEEFKNRDYRLSIVCFMINLPRLMILLLIVVWMIKSRLTIFYVFMIFEFLVELIQLIKGFKKMRELTHNMEHLPQVSAEEMKSQEDNTCMVCFREMEDGRRLPCNHIFHSECLTQWIQKNSNHFCPKCKRPFDFDKSTKKTAEPQNNPQGQNNDFVIRKQMLIQRAFLPQPRFQKSQNLSNILSEQAQQDTNQSTMFNLQQRPRGQGILGSLPYCLPTQAVYQREKQDFDMRNDIKDLNNYLISTLAYNKKLQMLLIPQ